MYTIEKKDFGLKLTFGGFIQKDEMSRWYGEVEKLNGSLSAKFSVFVDMRNLKPLPEDAQADLQKGQRLLKTKGMERSVVILNSPVLTIQFKRIAKETGIAAWERYIDASSVPNWEEKGTRWVANAIDSDR